MVGRVTKDSVVKCYSAYNGKITSSDGKTASECGNCDPDPACGSDKAAYEIGRWASGASLVISMDTSGWAPGYTCRWDFDADAFNLGGESSGNDCSAEITLGAGDQDWQNHLWFHLNPPCTIQGFKVMMPGNVNTTPASTQTITCTGPGGTYSTSNQPYVFSVVSGNYTCSTSVPSGHTVGSTLCIGNYGCHNDPPVMGASRTFNCPSAQEADLWWHYYAPTPTPTPFMTVRFKNPSGQNISHLVSKATWTCPSSSAGNYYTPLTNTSSYTSDVNLSPLRSCRGARIAPIGLGTSFPNLLYQGVTPIPSSSDFYVLDTRTISDESGIGSDGSYWFGWSNWNTGFREMTVILDLLPPTCTVSLSPSPLTVYQGESSSLVATVTNISPSGTSVNRVDFSSSDTSGTGVATVSPISDFTSSYSTTVTGQGVGSATLTANVYLNPGGVLGCSESAQVTVMAPSSWFQTKGGDVVSQGEIRSSIPSTALEKYFSLDLDGYPGVVSYQGDYDFSLASGRGEDQVSSKGWLAEDSPGYSYTYDYFYKKLDSPTTSDFSCDPSCPTPPSGQTTIYYSSGNVTLSGNYTWTIPSNTKVIVLVNGDLNIQVNPNRNAVVVPVGSFLAFIVKNDIKIYDSVGDKDTAASRHHLQGVYYAGNKIHTKFDSLNSGRRLVGAGIFYARGGFELKRDLKNDPPLNNASYPAELFIFRPDLVINIPQELKISIMSWQEVAP